MIIPREQLGFPCLLTKVFTHFGIEPGNETPSVGKESFGSASINKMFLPKNDIDKIMHGESKAEEEARLKKAHHEKIPSEKRKKADTKGEDTVPISSDSEERTSRKINKKEYIKLRKEINGLKDKFNHFRRSVQVDLSEIKWNLQRLLKKMGYKYSKRGSSPNSETSSDFDQFGDSFDDEDDSADISGKGKRPMTKSSYKKF